MNNRSVRHYSNREENSCMYAIGDGTAVVGLWGLDIYGAKGADLAGCFAFRGHVADVALIEAESTRLPGRFRYAHQIRKDGRPLGHMEEYFSQGHSFVREFSLDGDMEYVIEVDEKAVPVEENIWYIPKGSFYVNDYPTGEDAWFRLDTLGCKAKWEGRKVHIRLTGDCRVTIRFGRSREEMVSEDSVEEYNIPCPVTASGELAQVVEDYWYAYQSHHSCRGGSISHILWNLNYIRDNYGMSRGLLAMGLQDEARAQLEYYLRVFREKGMLATAQSVGCDGIFHIHECDETENPGYLVMQAFDYYRVTGDEAFLLELMPMLHWALEVQAKHLYDGMMPFCGDETYIAGGILPRSVLEHGSCEATMLFIKSAQLLESYGCDARILALAREAREKFRSHFFRDGTLITNNPARTAAPLPRTKHGPCIFCYSMTDLRPNRFGLYTCPDCAERPEDLRTDESYRLTCVQLEPAYFDTDLLTLEEQRQIYELIAEHLLEHGYMSNEGQEKKCTGYEFGLLLYGLVKTGSPLSEPVRRITMARRDEVGIWGEYYDLQGNPSGMRYRVWESSVNIMALLACERGS